MYLFKIGKSTSASIAISKAHTECYCDNIFNRFSQKMFVRRHDARVSQSQHLLRTCVRLQESLIVVEKKESCLIFK